MASSRLEKMRAILSKMLEKAKLKTDEARQDHRCIASLEMTSPKRIDSTWRKIRDDTVKLGSSYSEYFSATEHVESCEQMEKVYSIAALESLNESIAEIQSSIEEAVRKKQAKMDKIMAKIQKKESRLAELGTRKEEGRGVQVVAARDLRQAVEKERVAASQKLAEYEGRKADYDRDLSAGIELLQQDLDKEETKRNNILLAQDCLALAKEVRDTVRSEIDLRKSTVARRIGFLDATYVKVMSPDDIHTLKFMINDMKSWRLSLNFTVGKSGTHKSFLNEEIRNLSDGSLESVKDDHLYNLTVDANEEPKFRQLTKDEAAILKFNV